MFVERKLLVEETIYEHTQGSKMQKRNSASEVAAGLPAAAMKEDLDAFFQIV
jgi:hypothetical protein